MRYGCVIYCYLRLISDVIFASFEEERLLNNLKMRHIYIIISLGFLSASLSFIWGQISPIVALITNYSPSAVTQVVSFIFILSGIAQTIIGRLFDARKGNQAILISFIFYFTGCVLLSIQADNDVYTILGAAFAFVGLGGLYTTHIRLTRLATGEENLDKVGHYDYIAHNVGFSFASIIAYFFLKKYLGHLIILDLLTTFVATSGYLYYYNYLISNQKDDEINNKFSSADRRKSKISYRKIWKKILGMGMLGSVLTFHIVLLPSIYHSSNLDIVSYQALTFFVNAVIVVVFGTYLGTKLGVFSMYQRFLTGVLMLGIGFFGVYFVKDYYSLIFVTSIWTVGEILCAGPYSYYFFEGFSEDTKGQAAGLLVLLFGVGGGVLPLILSPILNISLFYTCVISGIAPIIAFVLLTTRSKEDLERVVHSEVYFE
jgi:hypothetical protein